MARVGLESVDPRKLIHEHEVRQRDEDRRDHESGEQNDEDYLTPTEVKCEIVRELPFLSTSTGTPGLLLKMREQHGSW